MNSNRVEYQGLYSPNHSQEHSLSFSSRFANWLANSQSEVLHPNAFIKILENKTKDVLNIWEGNICGTANIQIQAACSLQSKLDLHCPQKVLESCLPYEGHSSLYLITTVYR